MNTSNVILLQSAFPISDVPPILRDAALEVQSQTQAPISMIYSALLATLAIAAQDQISVVLATGHEAPVSMQMLTVAGSGERKTTVDSIATAPIRNFERSFDKLRDLAKIEHFAKIEIWEVKRSLLNMNFEKAFAKGLPTDAHERALSDHLLNKPVKQKFPKIIYTDATPQAIAWGLHTDWPSGALVSDEGGQILNGNAGRDLPFLNKLRDGDSLTVDRKSAPSFILSGANFSMSVQVQPETFEKFMEQQGRHARDNGFFSRCLVTWPESTQGTRFINSINTVEWKYLTIFHDRITTILQEGYKKGAEKSKVKLELSMPAKLLLMEFHNNIEVLIGNSNLYSDVRDAGSKVAETSVRMAALFHHLENRTGEIQPETYIQAQSISNWFLVEFKRIFGIKPKESQEYADSLVLLDWLRQIFQLNNGQNYSVSKNFIRQYCPNSLRSKNRLNRALLELIRAQCVNPFIHGKTNMIGLNPQYFNLQAPFYQYQS